MIISFEISVAELCELSTQLSETLFSEALRSSRRGHHIVIIPRSLARWAADNLELSGQDKAHLEKIREEFTQLGSLRNDPTSRVLKIISHQQDIQPITDYIWSIGIEEFLSGGFLEKPILLLENAKNDGELFCELISNEARRRGIRYFAFQVFNGGGATTFQEVARFADLKQIIICVCDHDKLTPYSARSETFRKAKEAFDSRDPVGVMLATPGREIENFLPFDLICRLYPEYPMAQREILESMIFAQADLQCGDCLWLYFDIKEGVNSTKFRQKCTSPEAREWVCAKYHIDDFGNDEVRIDGFGGNVVEQVLKSGTALSDLHRFTRSKYWLHHFATWFDNLLPFIQARSISRV